MRAVLDIFWNLPFTFRLINFTQKNLPSKILNTYNLLPYCSTWNIFQSA